MAADDEARDLGHARAQPPTDKISVSQYSAHGGGALFSRYGLVVTPINYPLTCVNILLFGSSFYHLSRKVKADYM